MEEPKPFSIMDDNFETTRPVQLRVKKTTQMRLLVAYVFLCCLSIGVSKMVLIQFPYSFLLSSFQLCATSVCSFIARAVMEHFGHSPQTDRTHTNDWKLILYSILFAWSISLPNYSLVILPLPLHHAIMSMTPIFTLLIFSIAGQNRLREPVLVYVTAISFGTIVCSVTAEYDKNGHTTSGLVVSYLAAFICACSAFISYNFQIQGETYAVLEILSLVSLAASVQMALWSFFNGEMVEAIVKHNSISASAWLNILMCLVISAVLNAWRMFAVEKVGPITLSVAGDVASFALVGGWNCMGVFLFGTGLAWFVLEEILSY